uniref:TAFA chemokine like family member 5 n=1 Tax=Pseudonaja textilis TaxID=8673 RepID=A0A670YCF1_PSETE
MQFLKALWALAGTAICCFLIFVIHSQFLKEGQLAAGTCEIVTLDRDSSQPRRTIARQTARCACKKGQIAGTTRARPACTSVLIIGMLYSPGGRVEYLAFSVSLVFVPAFTKK